MKRKKNPSLRKTFHPKACLACGKIGSDPAHIKTFGSTRIDADFNILALCRICHSDQHAKGWKQFLSTHPAVSRHLAEMGWTWEEVNGKFYLAHEKLRE